MRMPDRRRRLNHSNTITLDRLLRLIRAPAFARAPRLEPNQAEGVFETRVAERMTADALATGEGRQKVFCGFPASPSDAPLRPATKRGQQ